MLATVDLNELAQAVAPVARLVHGLGPGLPLDPEPGRDHPLAQRLVRNRQIVQLGELLGREGRPEIGVALAHDRQRRRADLVRQSAVARPATPPRRQPRSTVGPEASKQAENLARAQAQQRCRLGNRQAAILDLRQRLDPGQLRPAHHHHRHAEPPSRPRNGGTRVTSLPCKALTLARCAYTAPDG
jgi:hypothetical protein